MHYQPIERSPDVPDYREISSYLDPPACYKRIAISPTTGDGEIHLDRKSTTESLQSQSGKSPGVPDPERYKNVKGDIDLELWRIELENRLMVNDDHFNLRAARIAKACSGIKEGAQSPLIHTYSETHHPQKLAGDVR